MQVQDIVVGLAAIAAGLFLVVVSAINLQWYFTSWKTRWLDQRLGRFAARTIVALLGILLILLGMAIMRGFSPNASRTQRCPSVIVKQALSNAESAFA